MQLSAVPSKIHKNPMALSSVLWAASVRQISGSRPPMARAWRGLVAASSNTRPRHRSSAEVSMMAGVTPAQAADAQTVRPSRKNRAPMLCVTSSYEAARGG